MQEPNDLMLPISEANSLTTACKACFLRPDTPNFICFSLANCAATFTAYFPVYPVAPNITKSNRWSVIMMTPKNNKIYFWFGIRNANVIFLQK